MKTKTLLRLSILAGAFMAMASPVLAASVNLDSTVQNGNFEGGVNGSGTPNDWSLCCSGSPGAGVYTPSPLTTYYTSGSIPGGGTAALFVPGPTAGGAGSGYVVQDLGIGFTSGTTYTVDVYVAMPLITAPTNDGAGNHLDSTSITAELLVDNGGGLSTGGLTENVSYVNALPSAVGISSLGVWELITLSVTATSTSTTGQDLGLELGASMTSIDQPHEVDFVVPSGVPLPGALPLFGGGLGVLALLARRSKRKGVAKA